MEQIYSRGIFEIANKQRIFWSKQTIDFANSIENEILVEMRWESRYEIQ